MNTYCPKCWSPITPSDDGCSCEVCNWFGDVAELLSAPGSGFNLVRDVVTVLDLYRDACRHEFVAEQLYDAGNFTEHDINAVRAIRRKASHSLIEMFVKLKCRPNLPKEVLEKGLNGLLPWPDHWKDRHYNGSNEPCDMLIGFCACGAYHTEDEEWVQVKLGKHQAIIV